VAGIDALPVEAIFAEAGGCADRARAERRLREDLAELRAPRRGSGTRWTVDVATSAPAPGTKSVAARVVDDTGNVVAERTVTDRTDGACLPLFRAVSVWAQLVLDEAAVPEPPAPPVEHAPLPVDFDLATPAPRPKQRTYEVGTTVLLRNGAASTGGIFGVSPFFTVGFADDWVLRAAAIVGTSTSRVPGGTNVTLLGGRIDVCRRLPGNYIERRGIELDGCAGADGASVTSTSRTVARASLGPSFVLRGELGTGLSLEVRGMIGANVLRGGFEGDAPAFVASAEVGGSVRFR
jgi:hypothetical protein